MNGCPRTHACMSECDYTHVRDYVCMLLLVRPLVSAQCSHVCEGISSFKPYTLSNRLPAKLLLTSATHVSTIKLITGTYALTCIFG